MNRGIGGRRLGSAAALSVRLLGYLVLLVLASGAQFLGFTLRDGSGLPEPLPSVIEGAAMVAGVFAATWLFRCVIDKRPWSGMALPRPQWGRLAAGFAAGAALMLLICAIQFGLGWVRPIGSELGDTGAVGAAGFLSGGLILMLAVGLSEELSDRGYLFQTVGERAPIWAAVLISGLIFGLLHLGNGGFSFGFLFSAVGVTAIFVVLRLLTGSLWFPIGYHASWNWAQYNLVGISNVNDRSEDHALVEVAQTGPRFWTGEAPSIEGGLLVILVEGVLLLLLLRAARRRGIDWRSRLDLDGRTCGRRSADQG